MRAIGERCADLAATLDPRGCVSLDEERDGQHAAIAWARDGVRELAIGLGATRTAAAASLLVRLRVKVRSGARPCPSCTDGSCALCDDNGEIHDDDGGSHA